MALGVAVRLDPPELSRAELAEEAAFERRWLAPLRTLRINARRSVRIGRDAAGKLTFASVARKGVDVQPVGQDGHRAPAVPPGGRAGSPFNRQETP